MSSPIITVLYVQDVQKSKNFYQNLLGLPAIETSDEFVMFKLNEGAMLGLLLKANVALADSTPVGGGSELCLEKNTRDELVSGYQYCTEQGFTIAQPPTDLVFGFNFVVLDPDGHRVRYLVPSSYL